MIPLPSAAEMRSIDKATISGGVPSLTLMERAGAALFNFVSTNLSDAAEGRILILCGPGNNGGDGLVLARLLLENGFEVDSLLIKSDKFSPELTAQLKSLSECEQRLKLATNLRYFSEADPLPSFYSYSLIVDALLGTGSNSSPRGAIGVLIEGLSNAQKAVESFPEILSVDIPSGISADTGEVFHPAVSASHTASIEFIKRGMSQYPAIANCGEISVFPIGLTGDQPVEFSLLEKSDCEFPERLQAASHKGDFGRVLVIGGSKDMPGAPVLSAMAALRAGAGLVTLARPDGTVGEIPPELLVVNTPGDKGHFSKDSVKPILDSASTMDCLIIGPGLGRGVSEFLPAIWRFIEEKKIPCVVDADALNVLSEGSPGAFPNLQSAILTPHPGEMGRLLRTDSESVQNNRFGAAKSLSQLSKGVVVLKGARTIIYGDGHGAVCPTGNQYLATAGSGDVLCGVIAALLARGVAKFEAACKGVYLHGAIADLLLSEGSVPLIASDIVENISRGVGLLRRVN